MELNPSTHLSEGTAENFRFYFDWRLINYSILKKSTIWVEWKYLRLVYRQKTGNRPDDEVGEQVKNVIFFPF